MKQKVTQTLLVIVFSIIGILLFWYIYKDQNFSEIIEKMQTDFNYSWMLLASFGGILSHFIRSVRWRMLIIPLGYKPSVANTFAAVMVMYFANLIIPRSGEAVRCGIIKKYEKVPFSKLLGTVVIERAVDLVILLFLTVCVFVFQFNVILSFLENNPNIKGKFEVLMAYKYYYVGIGFLALSLLIIFRKKLLNSFIAIKLQGLIANLKEGFKSIQKLENKSLFWGYTFAIWLLYFFLIYLCFFSYQPTKHLSPLSGFTTLVMSSFGMVAPIQGGVGAWHFMVTNTLEIYGVDKELHGVMFALVAHGIITLTLLGTGAIAFVSLPFINKKKKVTES